MTKKMAKLLALGVLLGTAAFAFSQPVGVALMRVDVAPSGLCQLGDVPQWVKSTGVLWTCQGIAHGQGTWTALPTSAGGSGTVNTGTGIAYYPTLGAAVSGTSAIPNGITGTTQTPGDNTTKLATDAFANAAVTSYPGLASAVTLGSAIVTPEQYGALGNGGIYFDGAITSLSAGWNTGSTTTPTAPSVTTNAANEVVLNIFDTHQTWTTPPATGTQRLNLAFSTGFYGVTLNDQAIAVAGTVAASSGTYSGSANWQAGSLALVPKTGQTISFVNVASSQQNSGSSLVVNVPSGIADGDMLIACSLTYTAGSANVVVPAGFNVNTTTLAGQIFSVTSSSFGQLSCNYRVAKSEPASYTWTGFSGTTSTGFIAAYHNVASVDGSVLTSATAAFPSTAVGNLICTANTSVFPTGGEQCGTILARTSSTQITTNIVPLSTATGVWFSYGSDDTSAFQTMLTTSPCSTTGCQVWLSEKEYALSGPLAFPFNITITMKGAGAGMPNNPNSYVQSQLSNVNTGTRLDWLTQVPFGTAVTFEGTGVYGTQNTASITNSDILEDVALLGGVGKNHDGGGGNCIDILAWQFLQVKGIDCVGFVGDGIFIDANHAGHGFVDNILLTGMQIVWNNKHGINFGGVSTDDEAITISNNNISGNGYNGIYSTNGSMQGLTVYSNVIQWNNTRVAAPEMDLGNTAINAGCSVFGNYFEVDAGPQLNSKSNGWTGSLLGDDGCNYGPNVINYAAPVQTRVIANGLVYGQHFTPGNLPTCGVKFNGDTAVVTDATAPTYMGAYVSGGGITAQLICSYNGTTYAWLTH